MAPPDLNWLAVAAAAVSSFLLGGLWYSPVLFEKTWNRESGRPVDQGPKQARHPAIVFGIAFLLALFAAFVFALFLPPHADIAYGTKAGLAVGFCWVATSFGINYAFAQRSFKLWLIDAGYHTLQFVLYGVILTAWR